MRRFRKMLAFLLAALMLASALPVTALAAENETGTPVQAEESLPADRAAQDGGDAAVPAGDGTGMDGDSLPADGAPAEEISLEDVELVGLTANVNGVEIQAEPAIELFSLLPLETRTDFTLDLTGFFPEELKAVALTSLLENIKTSKGETLPSDSQIAVYARWYYYDEETGQYIYQRDNYTVLGDNTTIDLSSWGDASGDSDTETSYLELIVGTANQLDPANKRYRVEVKTSRDPFWFETAGANQVRYQYGHRLSRAEVDGGEDDKTFPQRWQLTITSSSDWEPGGNLPLVLKLNPALAAGTSDVKVSYQAAGSAIPVDVTNQIYENSISGYSIPLDGYYDDDISSMPKVSLTFTRMDGNAYTRTLYLYAYKDHDYAYLSNELYDPAGTGMYDTPVTYNHTYEYDHEKGVQMGVYMMRPGKEPTGRWLAKAFFYHDGTRVSAENLGNYITRTVEGYYTSAEATKNLTDITSQLFSRTAHEGYAADYSGSKIFTVVRKDGSLDYLGIKTVAYEANETPTNPSANTWLTMNGAYDAAPGGPRNYYSAYRIRSENDGYADVYQTLFLMKRTSASEGNGYTAVTDTTIYPYFYTDDDMMRVYAGSTKTDPENEEETKQSSGVLQTSEVSPQPFAPGEQNPIQYTTYAEDGKHYQNYWVTFITQHTGGAQLFVNGVTNAADTHKVTQEDGNRIAAREIHLDEADSYHDIFFANTGDTEMTGLSVTLEDAVNVQLDEYWTIKEGSTLPGLTTTDEAYGVTQGELPNVGKIRLRPIIDPDTGLPAPGPIGGTLTITSSGGTAEIKLTGTSGQLEITTDYLNEGVKYVPYISAIQTNYMGGSDATSRFEFSIVSGTSNTDIPLRQTGELYGMPMRPGTWTFTVRVQYAGAEWDALSKESQARLCVEKEFTLVIHDNTDENVVTVPGMFDYDYPVLNYIGQDTGGYHFVMDHYQDWDFRSEGPFDRFVNFYIDGILVATSRYNAREGSTVITIYTDTFEETGEGQHTIAAEFFEDKDASKVSTMRTSAQNYYMDAPRPVNPSPSPDPDPSPNPGSGSQPGGSNAGGAKPNGSKPETPTGSGQPSQPAVTPETPFTDVSPENWFYEDVKWVNDQGYMVGVPGGQFNPNAPVSQAQIVLILARLAGIDLSRYEGITIEDVPAGMWYTAAAIWAKQIGLLPDRSDFAGDGPLPRGDMAITLVKFLRSLGMDTSAPEQPVVFADAEAMTPESNAAFQVLYRYGIFRGYGNNQMGPENSTTRAEFSALVRRISNTMNPEEG